MSNSGTDWERIASSISNGEPAGAQGLDDALGSLRWYFKAQIGDKADDAYHELQLILIENIRNGQVREPSRMAGYANTIAHRIVAEQIRKRVHCRTKQVQVDGTAPCSTEESPYERAARLQG